MFHNPEKGLMMKRMLLLLPILLAGCLDPMALAPGRLGAMVPPQTEVVHLATTPDACYQHAYQTLASTPAQMLASDPTVRHVSGVIGGVVLMNIGIAPDNAGCAVTVHGSVLPNKLVTGELTEVREYVA